MIYLDNAATTARKPPEVGGCHRARHRRVRRRGPGRARSVARRRARGASCPRGACRAFWGAPSPSRVAFCSNATEALNVAIAGLLRPGERAVTTAASHNSVLRPLFRKEDEEGAEVAVVPHDGRGALDYGALAARALARRAPACDHRTPRTSRETCTTSPRAARLAHEHGALVVVDAAQTAGCVPIDMGRDGLDLVAFTGHKGLYGPQGTGGVAVAAHVEVPPFKEGGSGVRSYDRRHPARMPESLEAGTLNAHGLAGLAAGVAFVQEARRGGAWRSGALARAERFERGGAAPSPACACSAGGGDAGRCGIVALNVGDVDSAAVADALEARWGICTRAGAHLRAAHARGARHAGSGRGAVQLQLLQHRGGGGRGRARRGRDRREGAFVSAARKRVPKVVVAFRLDRRRDGRGGCGAGGRRPRADDPRAADRLGRLRAGLVRFCRGARRARASSRGRWIGVRSPARGGAVLTSSVA